MTFKIFMTGIALMMLGACASKAEREYVRGCVANGASTDLCECSYEKLQEFYPEEIFNNIEKGYLPPDIMNKMVESIQMCVTESQ